MPETPKAERVLLLLRLLRERKRTIPQLADLLGTIPRTLYRDIEALENGTKEIGIRKVMGPRCQALLCCSQRTS